MTPSTDFKQANRLAAAYQGPATGKRYEMWREGICRSFCRLHVGPSERAARPLTFELNVPDPRSARTMAGADSRIGLDEDSRRQPLPLSRVVILPTIVVRVQDV
jgi:hypothetical protein